MDRLDRFAQEHGLPPDHFFIGMVKEAETRAGSGRQNGKPKDEAPRCRVHTLADAMQPQPPVRFAIDGLFSEGSLSLVIGEPGCKKTWAMLHAALCIAEGRPWLDRGTEQGPTLIIDEESGARRLARRLAALARGQGTPEDAPIHYVSLAQLDLRGDGDVRALREIIEEVGAVFVVVDALADIMPGGDENAVKDVQPVLLNLRKVAEETGAAIVLIHHTNKAGGYRGSSAIAGAVDLMIKLESKADSSDIEITSEKVRDVEPFKMAAHITFADVPFRVTIREADPIDRPVKLTAAQRHVLNYLDTHGESSTSAILSKVEVCAPVTARKAIYQLARMGRVQRTDEGGPGVEATWDVAGPEMITPTCSGNE